MEVPSSLLGLLNGVAGAEELVATGSPLPDFHCHCPLLSLPLALGTNLGTIPSDRSYLQSDQGKTERWLKVLGSSGMPRVGIVWSGGTAHDKDQAQNIPLAELMAHLPQGFDYVSLQKELRDEDQAALQSAPHIRHFGDDLTDFAETAALCQAMDLVISVDSSVAHLAGAMGKRTMLLLPFSPDWRWLLERDDSPWYPSFTLLRQEAPHDWGGVFRRLSAFLAEEAQRIMQTVYINLARQVTRRNNLELNFLNTKQKGWDLARFPAVDTSYVRNSVVPGRLRDTEKACFLSHLYAVRQHLHTSRHLHVIEDDICFGKHTCSAVHGIISSLERDNHPWDIIFTEVCVPNGPDMLNLVKQRQQLARDKKITLLNLKTFLFAGATSYIINGGSKSKLFQLLSEHVPLDIPVDLYIRELVYEGRISAFVTFPFTTSFSEDALTSDIRESRQVMTDLVWIMFRKMIWLERDLKQGDGIMQRIRAAMEGKESEVLGTLIAATMDEGFFVE
jgi:GR25 family glycosyltransferase involved in LPS biosynthesis